MVSKEVLRKALEQYHGQYGEGRAYLEFLDMPKVVQVDILLKLANHIANVCADAEDEMQPEQVVVKAAWGHKHSHDLFIMLCLFFEKDWEVEFERLPYGRYDDVMLPYPNNA